MIKLMTDFAKHYIFLNYCEAQIFHYSTATSSRSVCQLPASASSFELLPPLHLSQGQLQ